MGYIILSEIKSHDVIKIDGPGIEGGCIFKCKSALVHSPTCTNKRINRKIVALHQCLYLPRSSNSYFPPHISRDSPGNTGPLVMRTTKGLLNNEIKLNISNKSANCWGEFRIFLVDTCTEARTLNLRIQMSGLGFQYARLWTNCLNYHLTRLSPIWP